jgi:hypothetical protein
MNVFGYAEEVLLFFKELLCNLSILEFCSMLTFYTWCVLLFVFYILRIWYIAIVAQNDLSMQMEYTQILIWVLDKKMTIMVAMRGLNFNTLDEDTP